MKCQLTYLLLAMDNVSEQVEDVIDFVDGYDLDYNVGESST